ncbi:MULTISPECIES: helix-turn-helix domain-containing protein [Serratia]|uniref:helix-turn-helix domain-containing protein n=1 Tax=Serratia TaxID=613 RepID=UPI0006684403|nr:MULTISPECIES: helix-turn-helix transcriptional regulator [Serratia]SAP73119.1 Helix-turn-helix [Klebsiella oxytoca]AVN50233.1 XRE family transcriptional regulator [Serratia marcescens]ELJ5771808.1 helix-turn-helix transcriptional regulator [Serratia marcescens]ELJ5815864.1 helix-turn-helix transcriptional regulator [Serratia marcescens]ELN8908704.1 helix-turn-helix transcriptional regulator [Serratia marcescens]
MKSINDIRRENLRDIINRDFDGRQVRLAERLEINANVISRWLKPATDKNHKTIGDSVARKLEIAANKPKFWLDRDHMMAMAAGAEAVQEETEVGAIVASNLELWMSNNRELSSQAKVGAAAGVGQSTVNRVLSREGNITINSLEAIAGAFGRRGYELLLKPKDPTLINYDRSQYAQLPAEDKAKIESFIEFVMQQARI